MTDNPARRDTWTRALRDWWCANCGGVNPNIWGPCKHCGK